MPRSFVWGLYVDDLGDGYAVKVDADYFADSRRGWGAVDPTTVPQLPRGWLPRKVFGYDEEGRSNMAIAATVDAPIWTGEVSTFVVYGADQLAHFVDIVTRFREKRLPSNSFIDSLRSRMERQKL